MQLFSYIPCHTKRVMAGLGFLKPTSVSDIKIKFRELWWLSNKDFDRNVIWLKSWFDHNWRSWHWLLDDFGQTIITGSHFGFRLHIWLTMGRAAKPVTPVCRNFNATHSLDFIFRCIRYISLLADEDIILISRLPWDLFLLSDR